MVCRSSWAIHRHDALQEGGVYYFPIGVGFIGVGFIFVCFIILRFTVISK
jgi:hypothetical protein